MPKPKPTWKGSRLKVGDKVTSLRVFTVVEEAPPMPAKQFVLLQAEDGYRFLKHFSELKRLSTRPTRARKRRQK